MIIGQFVPISNITELNGLFIENVQFAMLYTFKMM